MLFSFGLITGIVSTLRRVCQSGSIFRKDSILCQLFKKCFD